MLDTLPVASPRARVARRRPCPSPRPTPLRTVRPSLLDLRFCGDAWIVRQGDGAALYLGGFRLVGINALPLDVPSLNRQLQRARLPGGRRR
jgi:hypothetical protein